jgi:hypothetical protein
VQVCETVQQFDVAVDGDHLEGGELAFVAVHA